MQPNSRLTLYTLIIFSIFIILLIGISLALYFNRQTISRYLNSESTSKTEASAITDIKNDLFISQMATFTGKITKIDGNTIYVENEKGITGKATIADNVSIFDLSQATNGGASHDINNIHLNTKVLINFEVVNGEYTANTITYSQPILTGNNSSVTTATTSAQQ